MLLCAYPLVASVMDQKYQQSVIQTYQGEMNQASDEKVQEMKKEANTNTMKCYGKPMELSLAIWSKEF